MSHRETEPADGSKEQRHGKEQRNALVLNRLVQELAQANYTPITVRRARDDAEEDSYSPLHFSGRPKRNLLTDPKARSRVESTGMSSSNL